MIVLDTHVWFWWVHGDDRLKQPQKAYLDSLAMTPGELGVPAISCWEVAKLVEKGRLEIGASIKEWLVTALNYPGIQLVPLTPEIAAESTTLPGAMQTKDPADQLIVATTRILNTQLATADGLIQQYAGVKVIQMG